MLILCWHFSDFVLDCVNITLCVCFSSVVGRAASGQTQLHHNDEVHQQTGKPQTHDESTER